MDLPNHQKSLSSRPDELLPIEQQKFHGMGYHPVPDKHLQDDLLQSAIAPIEIGSGRHIRQQQVRNIV
jgi:hypothetical protein